MLAGISTFLMRAMFTWSLVRPKGWITHLVAWLSEENDDEALDFWCIPKFLEDPMCCFCQFIEKGQERVDRVSMSFLLVGPYCWPDLT